MPKAFEFEAPYALRRQIGGPYFLDYHGMPVASYNLDVWGSEERIIQAAWRWAYDPDYPHEEDPFLRTRETEMRAALQSIADNTCCDGCGEAARVAKSVLARLFP